MAPSSPMLAPYSPSQYPEKNLYHNDNYILVDGDKQAYVRPTYGIKQGCPLSPLLFSIYLNYINEVSDRIEGTCTGTPNFHVSNLQYADDFKS
eukprot:88091-Pelagomonas_calceolata.AAC.1